MTTEYVVKKGDVGPTLLIGSSQIVSTSDGWTCQLRVYDAANTQLISRSISDVTDDLTKFVVYITAAESTALAIDSYRMVIELANATISPPFNVEDHYTLNIDPEIESGDDAGLVPITAGSTSFASYETLLRTASEMPHLSQIPNVSRASFRAALVNAYQNIGLLTVDFDVYDVDGNLKTSTLDFTSDDLTALDAKALNALVRAQLIETNNLLGGNPVEDRRRMGLLSDSVGESAHFFRTAKPLELPVYRETALALRGYLVWTARIAR